MTYYYEQGYGNTARWYVEMPGDKYLWIRVEGGEIAYGITTNHVLTAASREDISKLIMYIFTKEHI